MLINRSHVSRSDPAADANGKSLFQAIGRGCLIAAIAEISLPDIKPAVRLGTSRHFFQRLWQYTTRRCSIRPGLLRNFNSQGFGHADVNVIADL